MTREERWTRIERALYRLAGDGRGEDYTLLRKALDKLRRIECHKPWLIRGGVGPVNVGNKRVPPRGGSGVP